MSAYTQTYKYGKTSVEVQHSFNSESGEKMFKCLVRGYGHRNPAPRKTYIVKGDSNAQASRNALQLYRKEFGEQ